MKPAGTRRWLWNQFAFGLKDDREILRAFGDASCDIIQDAFMDLPAPTKSELVPTWDHRRDGAE
jgi:hypothetical protein